MFALTELCARVAHMFMWCGVGVGVGGEKANGLGWAAPPPRTSRHRRTAPVPLLLTRTHPSSCAG